MSFMDDENDNNMPSDEISMEDFSNNKVMV